MPTYNANPNVQTLALMISESSGGAAEIKGKIWSKMLEANAETADDFKLLEGAAGSDKPFWKKRELAADGGDKIVFSTIGGAAGPGARGEVELTGRTSKPRMGAYTLQVDWFRDAVELTKKEIKFLATGRSIESVILEMLGKKMGRKRMYDMMHTLSRTTGALILRPGGKTSRNTIRHTDVLTPSFLVEAKARLEGRGARPVGVAKSKSGSPVHRYLAFIGQNAMVDIVNSSSYQSALNFAADRGDENTQFSGRLKDWNGIALWEHIVVDPDSNDAIGSPIAPKAILDTAITDADATFALLGGDGTHATLPEYFRDFPGYDYLFTEDQTPAADSTSYYFWVVNASGADAGKANFYKYTGSANTGNQITAITERLYSSTSGTYRKATVGDLTYAGAVASATALGLAGITFAHPAGSFIIPANSYGVPIAQNFIFGAGCALRGEGSISMDPIYQDRDYKFVKGMGYESIYGQRAALDTLNIPRGYVVLESAYSHPGIGVPYMGA